MCMIILILPFVNCLLRAIKSRLRGGFIYQTILLPSSTIQDILHFNNAGAALMPQPVLHATIGNLQLEALIGGYEAAAQAHDAVAHVYDAAATLLGCSREEIAIVENATRS